MGQDVIDSFIATSGKVTIAAGQSLSSPINLVPGRVLAAIYVPAVFAGGKEAVKMSGRLWCLR